MGMRLQYITPLLAAGAAAVAIVAAPTASATDQQSCNGSGSGTACLSPGADLTVQDFALALGLVT